MGKGQTKGRKGHKGKARPAGNKGRAHTEEAWRHAQQVNARWKAEGKDARSTASISRSQRRAQQHHLAKAKAKPEAESSRARSRSPLAAAQLQRLPKGPGPGGAGARDDPLVQKLQVRFSLSKNIRGSVQQRLTRCRSRASFSPRLDALKMTRYRAANPSLPAQRKATASEPSRKRAMAEHGKLESAQDAEGDVTPLSELGQAVKAPPVEPAHATTAERTDAATASTNTAVAGPQPKTSAAGIPPGGPAGVDEDEYTSESTEEVPALRGEPLTGVRMWTPSQFPLVMTLCKDLKSGEFLPEEVQVERLGYGRTRAVYSLPSIGPYSHYGDCVLKLCLVRQHHGKEAEWGPLQFGGDHNPQGASQPGLWAGSQVCTLQHPKACCHGQGLASTMGQQPIAGA